MYTRHYKLFFSWAAFRWVLLMFLIAPGLEAPLKARVSGPAKPLRVWTGRASWYGEDFHGRTTASGEVYNMHAATAAHPTLAFGSVVRLTNPRTGKSQTVRINDRGPYVEGRDIDLSYYAARRLGINQKGLARVRIELLEVPQRRSLAR